MCEEYWTSTIEQKSGYTHSSRRHGSDEITRTIVGFTLGSWNKCVVSKDSSSFIKQHPSLERTIALDPSSRSVMFLTFKLIGRIVH